MTNITTIDVETTLRPDADGKLSPDPHIPENEVVWIGHLYTQYAHAVAAKRSSIFGAYFERTHTDILVGHNIKFDLHYLNKTTSEEITEYFTEGGKLWDTMVAEYLLTNQEFVGNGGYSLDAVCERRALPVKPGDLAEKYWNKGVSTEDIPDEEVEPYLKHDVEVTHHLALLQIKEAAEQGRLPYIQAMMDSVLATFLIEREGLGYDRIRATELTIAKAVEAKKLKEDICTLADDHVKDWGETFNPASRKDLSLYFFGGRLERKVRQPVLDTDGNEVKYKSGLKKGQVRTKLVTEGKNVSGLCKPHMVGSTTDTKGVSTVDREVLKNMGSMPSTSPMSKMILELRDLEKTINTYLLGYMKKEQDGKIHASFKHTVTPTGRLSCASPNIQNIKDGEFKDLFHGRGTLVEADYSQLEIRVLAELSGCGQLRRDLDEGVDLHAVRASEWLRKPLADVTSGERKQAKQISFQLQYGAGIKSIAKTNGITEADAKRFVDCYYARYPGVRLWQDTTEGAVTLTRKPSSKKGPSGMPLGKGTLSYGYGRGFTFYEKENHGYGKPSGFYPPDLKNYPVQGVATGDVVQLCLGRLARAQLVDSRLRHHDWAMVNTVHDSILIGCHEKDLTYVTDMVQYYMEDMPRWLKEQFGWYFETPLPTDVKVGATWFDMKELIK
jgi:DNA polymerase I-like protein with 3'-5' exonuclease and polymerase domains